MKWNKCRKLFDASRGGEIPHDPRVRREIPSPRKPTYLPISCLPTYLPTSLPPFPLPPSILPPSIPPSLTLVPIYLLAGYL